MWLDNLIAWFSPETACKREAHRQYLKYIRSIGYDAADYSRVNRNWSALIESAEMTDKMNRDTIRARSRDLERNSDIANSIINTFVRNVVGNGYNLQAKTNDENINNEIEKLWKRWTKARNCDVTGQQSFSQLLRMAVRRKKVDGGILFKKCYTEGGVIPFKLQALEVDELSFTWSKPRKQGNKVVGGIEYNSYNRPVGYWITQYSIDGYDLAEPIYYDAKDIIFLYSKKRPSQIREISDMSPSITRIRDTNEFITAVSVKERIAACLAVFIKKQNQGSTIGRGAMPPTVEGQKTYEGKMLSPGMISELNVGDEIQVVDPKGNGGETASFLKIMQRLIGAGQGLSYEAMSRDMSDTNYSSARQAIIEDEMTYSDDIELLIENFMDEVYETFVISCVVSGAIKLKDFWSKKEEYLSHIWIAGQKKWIDPKKEAEANRIALECGLKTFPQIAKENGKDYKEMIDEMAEAQAYMKEKGIILSYNTPAYLGGGEEDGEE